MDADSEHLDPATSSLQPHMTAIIYLCVISWLIQKGCAKSWRDVLVEVHAVGFVFQVKQSALELGLEDVVGLGGMIPFLKLSVDPGAQGQG